MYKSILLGLTLLICGCAPQYPTEANLNLQIKAQPPVYSDTSVFIQGHDARGSEEVIVYLAKDQPPIKVDNMSPPHLLITERLASALRDQGVTFENNADTRIFLEINELLVSVSRPKFLYTAEAKTNITLKVVKESTSLAKKYDRVATNESAKRPGVHQLENMLNDQLSEIIAQILQDQDIRKAISSR